jgi:4-amino-4-deoxy-L-arabinose transferase-like glycosyltransferase
MAPDYAAAAAPAPKRRRSRAALIVFLLTTLNALGWGLIVPPFHVPDEASHAFYAQYLGETGKLPTAGADADLYSADINAMLNDGTFYWVIGQSTGRPAWGPDAKRRLARDQAAALDRVGRGDAASASNNPPLYYAAQAVVYRAAHGLGPMNRLALMRALSALMAGLTGLCVFCFLRELLPGTPLAWTVGALAAGLQPLFAFVSSGVNNDAGLYLASAALMFALAVLLRRGLTARRAAAVGALLGAGILIKTQLAAYAPAVGLALLLAAWRAPRGRLRGLGAGIGAGALPLAIYGVLGMTLWDRPLLDRAGDVTVTTAASRPWHLSQQLTFLWQEYLPRLPLMTDLVPGLQPWQVWFKGLVGYFGWLDYRFPAWVYPLVLGVVVLMAIPAFKHLWDRRATLLARWGEIAVFGLAAGGLMLAIGLVSYRWWLFDGKFEQARYLLPLLPLFALLPALAVRGVGRRFAPVVGVLIVAGALGLSIFAQLLTLARYYG